MYPYDENNNNVPENENNSEPRTDAPAEDGSYRIVKPDAERSTCYRDASYTPQGEASFDSYYVPGGRGGKPAEPEKKPHKRGMGAAGIIALCLVCALLGGVSGGLIANANQPAQAVVSDEPAATDPLTQVSPSASGTTTSSDGEVMSARDIYYNLACEQVVGIQTDITTTNVFGMTVSGSVSGSGFVISEDGYILTNYHVIEDAYTGGYEVKIMFYNGDTYTAEIKGFDRNNDIAVLKIDAEGLNAATLGSSDSLYVGDTVYAVGNPLGELSYSMTSGMVSATDRLITTEEGTMTMFQFDAAVNEGNSGGPVYNTSGQVVGVVTAKSSEDGTEGLGFAVPIDDAVRIANSVISGERSLDAETGNAALGITGQNVDSMAAQYYGFPTGVYVMEVTSGGAAEKAGIKAYDIITELDGYAVSSMDELKQELLFHSAGETAEIVVWRSGEYLTLTITFDEKADDSSTSSGGQVQPEQPSYNSPCLLFQAGGARGTAFRRVGTQKSTRRAAGALECLFAFSLQEEVHDLADENDDHADGGDPLEAEVEEAVAPELVTGLLALCDDEVLGLELPADQQAHYQRAEGHQDTFAYDVEEVKPAVYGHRDLACVELLRGHAQQVVGGRDGGAAAAQSVEGDGDADDEGENSRNAGDLLAVGFLALVEVLVDLVGADDLEQGDGRSDSRDEDQEVEHEADEVAEAAHVEEDLLHGGEQESRSGAVLNAESSAGRHDGHGGHEGGQGIEAGDHQGVFLKIFLLVKIGAVGDHGAHA